MYATVTFIAYPMNIYKKFFIELLSGDHVNEVKMDLSNTEMSGMYISKTNILSETMSESHAQSYSDWCCRKSVVVQQLQKVFLCYKQASRVTKVDILIFM